MVAPPPDLILATKAPASEKGYGTLPPSRQASDTSLMNAALVLSMSCSEEGLSSSISSSPTILSVKHVNSAPSQSDASTSSSLSDDAINLKTEISAEPLQSGQDPQVLESCSCLFSSQKGSVHFPEGSLPPAKKLQPRTHAFAAPQAGCFGPSLLKQNGESAPKAELLPAFGPCGFDMGVKQAERRRKDIEQQLSSMEARLKAVQKQKCLWLQELVPAVRQVHLELADIGQSLSRLVQLLESRAWLPFQRTQEKTRQ